MRGIYHSLSNIKQKFDSNDTIYSDLKEFADDPSNQIEMLKKNIIRRCL